MRKTHTNFQECVNQMLGKNVTLWIWGDVGGEVGMGERMQIINFLCNPPKC